MRRSRSFPERPTKGSPARSSSRPGPSPMNMRSAVVSPTPKTTWVRVSARTQRVQPRASVRISSREPTGSGDLGCELVHQMGEFVAPFEHGHVTAAGKFDEGGLGQDRRHAAGQPGGGELVVGTDDHENGKVEG